MAHKFSPYDSHHGDEGKAWHDGSTNCHMTEVTGSNCEINLF